MRRNLFYCWLHPSLSHSPRVHPTLVFRRNYRECEMAIKVVWHSNLPRRRRKASGHFVISKFSQFVQRIGEVDTDHIYSAMPFILSMPNKIFDEE
ncbi:hypothetical protein TNIN_118911 [Trichonephila inaurata madagascariensis]|uniref:Uncharacterized protein n=1 Tax=Trichonephila inaurata madagascariensis TaxID=2747483 RepID=A0A8X6YXR0_9ARAC|nr:hypothetical protein TNIN_118911 [Trichonephila inaurata madagascariensis]